MAALRGQAVAALVAITMMLTLLPANVQGHAGHMHTWPDTPTGRNYIRQVAGTCNNFQDISNTGWSASGSATIWMYLYGNCSDSAATALEFNITITQLVPGNGTVVRANYTFPAGYAQNVTCGATNGASTIYLQDAADGSDDENMLWFHNYATNPAGGIVGNAANSFIARTVLPNGTVEANNIASFVFYIPGTAANTTDANNLPTGLVPTLCCNAALVPKPVASFFNQTQPCYAVPLPPDNSATASPPPGATVRPPPPSSVPPRPPTPPSPGQAASLVPAASLLVSSVLGAAVILAALLP